MSDRDNASKSQHGQHVDTRAKDGRLPRREFLRAAGGAAAVVLGGLAGGRGAAPSLPAAEAASLSLPAAPFSGWTLPGGPISETFWDSTSFLKTKLYNEYILPTYKRLRPNYNIRYESIDTSDLLQKLLAATATGTAPEIFELGDWFFPTYFSKNLLAPVTPESFGFRTLDEMLGAYVPGSLAATMYNGKLYGIPDFVAAHSLFINNRLFKEAGLDPVKDAPKTWDDVARLNKVLTKRQGDQIVQKGFEWRYSGVHWMAMGFHHLMYQAGGEMLQDGKPVFNSEAGVRALQVWKSVTTAPKVTKNTSASPFQDFANEQDAMTFIGPNGSRQAEGLNPRMKDNITVVPLPQINPAKPATMAYSFDIVVNTKIPEPKQRVAWDFVHMAVYNPKIWLSNNGSLLPYRAWATSSEAKQTLQFFDVFIHDLSIGRPMARTDHFNEFEDVIARAIERAVFNNADPKQSLDQAAAEFTRALKG